MSQTLKPIAPIRDPQMDKMVRDLYARVGRLEPEVARLGQRVVGVTQEAARIGAERGLRFDVYATGIPAPIVGDACYFDQVTGTIYKAHGMFRNQVFGVLDGSGSIITQGKAKNLRIYTTGIDNVLYLTLFQSTGAVLGPGPGAASGQMNFHYDTNNDSMAQSVLVPASTIIHQAAIPLRQVGSPTYYVYAELRGDDGTGLPGTTVYAVSDSIYASYIGAFSSTQFTFYTPVLLSAGLYHICLKCTSLVVSNIDYLQVDYVTPSSYAAGQASHANEAGVWTADATRDLLVSIYSTSYDPALMFIYPNLTAVHPLSQLTSSPLYGVLDAIIIGVGTGRISNYYDSMDVSIKTKKPVPLLNDTSSDIYVGSVTYVLGRTASINPALWDINFGDCTTFALGFRHYTEAGAGEACEVKLWVDGAVSSGTTINTSTLHFSANRSWIYIDTRFSGIHKVGLLMQGASAANFHIKDVILIGL